MEISIARLILIGPRKQSLFEEFFKINLIFRDQHGDWVYKWPTTLLLQTKTKLIDSYREVHPDPKADPGITWSTVNKMASQEWNYTIPEPQDRIDFIFYRSSNLKTIDSQVYAGDFKP